MLFQNFLRWWGLYGSIDLFFWRVIVLKSQEWTRLAALGTLPVISFDSAVDFTYRDFVLFFSYGIG